jgi:hypothetical protein
MTVRIYPTGSALHIDCHDLITVEEARYMMELCLAAAHGQQLDFIIDCSNLVNLAPGVFQVLANYTEFVQHPNTRWLTIVTDNVFLKNAIQVLFHNPALRIFDDREAAALFLRDWVDETVST